MSKYVLNLEVANVGGLSPMPSLALCAFSRYSFSISLFLKNRVTLESGGLTKYER